MDFSTIAAAVAAARIGDTIEVRAGTYVNDYVSINKSITLQAIGGMVDMVSTGLIPNGKAIFITNGDITITNFTFSGARVINRHPPDGRLFWGTFRPVEARCKEIQLVAGCVGGQIGGLAAAKGWSASRGLHQGTP